MRNGEFASYNNNIDLLNYYKRYTKELSKKIRETKKEYYNNMIRQSKNKIATTWNIIKMEKRKTCTKDNIIKMEVNGSVNYNPQIIASVVNQYFLLVGNNNLINITKTNCKDVTDDLLGTFGKPFPRIQYNNITRHEVEKIIKSLNASNSCDYDEIPVKIVKISSRYISSPLTKLCNRILSTGVFPDYLKYSEILPLFKSGCKDEIDSYRPISLLPSFSKIFEKLIQHRLISHFNDHNIWQMNNLVLDRIILLIRLFLSY
jgi:hypothetical protein